MPTDVEWLDRALKVTPGGSQTRSKAPGRVGPADRRVGYPLYADGGHGAYLEVGGRDYLDFIGSNAATPLGYGHPEIVKAVEEAVKGGNLLSLASTLEVVASETFCRLVQADSVRWLREGTSAVVAAIRLARAQTGASALVLWKDSYHGWSDASYARFHMGLAPGSHALANGVPSVLGPTVFQYADTPGISEAVNRAHERGMRVAAILVEPDRLSDCRHLMHEARRVADQCGAVMVSDEMVYGFRWHLRGAAGYYDVQPDLQTYGKAIASGVPLSAVCGRRDIMEKCGQAFISGTYGGDRIGLAALLATIGIYERENVIERLWRNGQLFWDTFKAENRSPAWLVGFPVHFAIRFGPAVDTDAVLTRCAQRGIVFHRDACNASAAMTREEVVHGASVLAEELNKG